MGDTRTSRSLYGGLALLILGLLATLLVIGSSSARAETGQKALVLGSSVSGGASSPEAIRATNLGFTVTVVDDPTWAGMTAAQFADHQLIIVGDPTCSLLPEVVSQNAAALADAVMARASGNPKAGNRILIGTDPVFHLSQGGNKVVDAGIAFAGAQDGASGLYLDFTCLDEDYDGNGIPDGQDKLLPLLSIAPTPVWTQNQGPPCGGDVSLISNAAQFSTLSSSDIRGWSCSVHETFPTFPTDWSALAIATDTVTKPTCGSDVDTGETKCGEAYLLIAGSGIVSEAPDLSLSPTSATNPVGTQHTVTATVTNPDDTPRSGVVVSFVVTGANAGAVGTCVPADCTSNAEGKVTFTYTGTNAGVDTINAAITVDGSRQTATASKTWEAGGFTISLTKTPSITDVCTDARTLVTYSYTVTNTSTSFNASGTVTDPDAVFVDDTFGPLAPGASETLTATATVNATTTNTGTANATFDDPAATTATASSSATVTAHACSINIEKATNGQDADTPPGPTVPVGSPVNWTYVVTNTGGLTLTNVKVTDDQGVAVACPATTLAPAQSMTCTASASATAGQYANVGTATGTPPNAPDVTDGDPSHYFGQEPATGAEGCTMGFWKNHLGAWTPTGFGPDQTVESVFDVPDQFGLDDDTLLEALRYKGGPGPLGAARILLRAAAAAILNAAHPDVNYALSQADIIADVNAALAGSRAQMLALATDLDKANNAGCPLTK